MADPIWLDGYSGQRIDELIALERTHRIDSLLLALEQAIRSDAAQTGPNPICDEARTVLAIEALEREVNNGGYHQFFVNTPEFAPVIVESLRQIGCLKVASITEDAISALKLTRVTPDEVEQVIYDEDEVRDQALTRCDEQFFEYPEPIADRLFAFVKANRDKFKL